MSNKKPEIGDYIQLDFGSDSIEGVSTSTSPEEYKVTRLLYKRDETTGEVIKFYLVKNKKGLEDFAYLKEITSVRKPALGFRQDK